MLVRLIADRLRNSSKSTLLLGPRQVGKSSLAETLQPHRYINFADEEQYLNHSRDPALLKRELLAIETKPNAKLPALVVIDEVQRIPAALNTIQFVTDTRKDLRFLLTGSSARKLRKEKVNLLPGRIVLEYLDPLSLSELGEQFELPRALQVGMLPGVYLDTEQGADVLGTYAEIYLREEIRAEALTRNFGAYARFLDVAALSSGEWINYSKLASDAAIPIETLRRYVEILQDTLVAFTLPPFHDSAKVKTRRVLQRERFFIFDIGVRNALLGIHQRYLSADQIGSAFEQWFIQQLFVLNRALRKSWRLSSFRTAHGAEVDVVIETEQSIIAIEIKSGKTIRAENTNGLTAFQTVLTKPKPLKKWIVYTGENRQQLENNITAIPYREALQALEEY